MIVATYIALLGVTAPSPVDVCITASEAAQKQHKSGQFLAARQQFLTCADARCPAVIRKDCETRLKEVRLLVPSFVVSVIDAQGADVVDAAVLVDGHVAASKVSGRPIEQEPGEHIVSIRRGQQVLQRKVVLLSGDRARRVQFQLPSLPTTLVEASDPVSESSNPVPIILASAGAVALASFVTLGAVGLSKRGALADSPCGMTKTCSREDTQSTRRLFLAADLSLVAAAVLGGSALTVWLLD